MTTDCHCHRCNDARREQYPYMVLCPTCGNKRCPRASDHRLDCTGSNAPGQAGSIYDGVVIPAARIAELEAAIQAARERYWQGGESPSQDAAAAMEILSNVMGDKRDG